MSAYTVTVNGESYTVYLKNRRGMLLTFFIDGQEYTVSTQHPPSANAVTVDHLPAASPQRTASVSTIAASTEMTAPLPGIVSDIKVKRGDLVAGGTTLLVIEAMKMENPIKAAITAAVKEIHVSQGQEVAHGTLLISLEPS